MTREEAKEILRHYDDSVWQQENKVTMGMIANAIRMGEEALSSPWRSVKEELPKENGKYLTYRSNGFVCTTNYSTTDEYWDTVGYQSDIKFWMPIPEIKKEYTE